jgi:type II secretion system protein J
VKIEMNHTRAFTLIEMILAIGVAAIVLVAVNTVLFTALHLRNATADAVDAATPVDAAVAFLKRDLECTLTPTNGTSKYFSGSFKVGNLTSAGVAGPVAAEFYTATGALGANAPWGDIQRVTYELKNSLDVSGQRDLYRSVTRNLLSVSTPDVTDQLMLSGVDNVKFSCYDGSQWQDTWDTSDVTSLNTNLPLAVRVEIQMNGGGNASPAPIELVVPIDSVSRTNMVLASSTGN